MNMLQKIFGSKVKAAREALGLSQYSLADMLHVRSLTVSKWERGLTWPQPEVVDELAELSGRPAYWFFMPDGPENEGLALPYTASYHRDIVAFSSEVQPTFASF